MVRQPESTIFKRLCNALYANIPADELNRLFSWECCELDRDFPCFADVYADIPLRLPKNFIIIDMGCNQALQSEFFKDYVNYIGVDCAVPNEWRLWLDNGHHYQCTIQTFLDEVLPHMGLNLERTFAICSYVPDKEARQMVRETFRYYRDYYGCDEWQDKFPVIS